MLNAKILNTLSEYGIGKTNFSFKSTLINGTNILSLILDVCSSTRFSSSVYPDDPLGTTCKPVPLTACDTFAILINEQN